MSRTGRVRVAGPLAAYAGGFGAELDRLGYSRSTAEAQLQLMAHVSAWLEGRELEAGHLTTAWVEEYWSTGAPAGTFTGSRRAGWRRCWCICAGWASCRPRHRRRW